MFIIDMIKKQFNKKKYLKKYFIDSDNLAEEYFNNLVANPGIMLPYSIGKIEMLQLKSYAEKELQDNFNVKEFNKIILDTGNVQFDILKKQVEKYIEANK